MVMRMRRTAETGLGSDMFLLVGNLVKDADR